MIRTGPVNVTALTDPATPCLSLRPREAAAALGVSERTLWGWTQRGDVPHIRRGKTILYPVDMLRKWLEEQAQACKGATHESN